MQASWLLQLAEESGKKFAQWVKLRNIPAHEYLDIKRERIDSFNKMSEAHFRAFLEAAEKFLQEESKPR